jgi:hypothetical protein
MIVLLEGLSGALDVVPVFIHLSQDTVCTGVCGAAGGRGKGILKSRVHAGWSGLGLGLGLGHEGTMHDIAFFNPHL